MIIDKTKFFIPEKFTPLYYTPIYEHLECKHKLRYNQLNALLFNEQFIFFESTTCQTVANAILKKPELEWSHDDVKTFQSEEETHWKWFHALNVNAESTFYKESPFHFIEVSPKQLKTWNALTRRIDYFPLFLWIIYMQEERALYYANTMIQDSQDLEPNYVSVQKKHLDDEESHSDIISKLLEILWYKKNKLIRTVNAKLFSWIILEFFLLPKRSGMKIIDQWLAEFTELKYLRSDILCHFKKLSANMDFVASLYGKDVIPNTWDRFCQLPEFKPFLNKLTEHDYELSKVSYSS